jgi:hypothetical protein
MRHFLLSASALLATLALAAGASAADRVRADAPVTAAPETAAPAEQALRRGWLAFSKIDDARDALRAGQSDRAAGLIERARATAADGRDADPRVVARLADAARALAVHDPAGADRSLAEASSRLRSALVAADLRQHPSVLHAPSGETSSYGGYGFGPRGLTGDRGNPNGFTTPPVIPPSGPPTFHSIEPYQQ